MSRSDPSASHCAEPEWLFAYGTLGPAGSRNELGCVWIEDAVRGRLFDLGPYPALVDPDDPEAGWVEGHRRSVTSRELEGWLDSYEGVDEGLYRRVALRTRTGHSAWAYVYARPLPQWARGPLSRWESSGSVADRQP